ncbi:MAG: 6-aminohexanoate hydrolase [Candidatus Latescibacteria bacterium]|nr:6-aminohexanoate hydrolase [Candidatus Latescibacterota bacterium]
MSDSPPPVSNDTATLKLKTTYDKSVLTFDFPALHIGIAEYPEGPTGCTVFYFPAGVSAAIDHRGGAVGSMETNFNWYEAICFSGGSLYGLESTIGVRAELFAKRQYKVEAYNFPTVSGAVIGDWSNRENTIYPDKALGRAALQSAQSGAFPLGRCGAGISARVGGWFWAPYESESAGQGGASYQLGAAKLLAFTVVNASGVILNRQGEAIRGGLNRTTGRRYRVDEVVSVEPMSPSESSNTTLTLIVTNVKLTDTDLQQFAKQVHTSMARAIYPFQTPMDGDILYAVTTNEEELATTGYNAAGWGWVAGEIAWEAVLHCYEE